MPELTGDADRITDDAFFCGPGDLATPRRGLKIPVSVVRFRPWALFFAGLARPSGAGA